MITNGTALEQIISSPTKFVSLLTLSTFIETNNRDYNNDIK